MNSCIPETSTSGCREQFCQENICLVLLVGVPGSGKSSLRVFLENYFKDNHESVLGTVRVFSVCYDDFCKVRNPVKFSDGVKWKENRHEVFTLIQNSIKDLKNYLPWDSTITSGNIRVINSGILHPDTVLFIIDDNMYYQSMRYEYFKLSRSYNLSFCQIFFNTTLQEALKYNKKRESQSQVPDFLILKMFEKLEPPDKTIPWEENTLYITPYIDFEEEKVLYSILSMIQAALKCPVQQKIPSQNKEAAQEINNSNAIHQIDIILKQLVGDSIKKVVKEKACDPRTISQHLSDKRLEVLKEIKDRKIALPVDLSLPITKSDIEVIKPILSACLNSSLGF